MKPTVLHVAAFANAAGGGFVSSLARLAREDAFETALLCPQSSEQFAWSQRLRDGGVRVIHASTRFDVATTVAQIAPAVVHAHFVDWMLPATLGAVLARSRVAWHLHTGAVRAYGARDLARRVKYASAKRLVERFFCVSPDLVEYLERYGVPQSRIAELPNGVDVQRFRPPTHSERTAARQRFGVARGDRAIAFFGRDAHVKGADRLAEALGVMASPPRVLTLAASEESLRALRNQRVIDAGSVADVREAFWACDALALPSRIETLAYALLEARACDLPAVASPLPAIADALECDAGTALVDPADARAFAAALDRALERGPVTLSPALREAISLDRWAHALARWYAPELAA